MAGGLVRVYCKVLQHCCLDSVWPLANYYGLLFIDKHFVYFCDYL